MPRNNLPSPAPATTHTLTQTPQMSGHKQERLIFCLNLATFWFLVGKSRRYYCSLLSAGSILSPPPRQVLKVNVKHSRRGGGEGAGALSSNVLVFCFFRGLPDTHRHSTGRPDHVTEKHAGRACGRSPTARGLHTSPLLWCLYAFKEMAFQSRACLVVSRFPLPRARSR